MTESEPRRDLLETLATDFVGRRRNGEYPSIEEYAADHPESADSIRDLLPVVEVLERVRQQKQQDSASRALGGLTKLERLGDFRIISELGRGGMGVVFEAEQESLERRVAIKVMPRQSLLGPKRLLRFRQEAQAAAKLHHTNIVPVFGVGQQGEYHYYVMQLIRGVGLDNVIAELQRRVGHDRAQAAVSATRPHGERSQTSDVVRLSQTLVSGWDKTPTEPAPGSEGSAAGAETANADASAEAPEKSANWRFGPEYWRSVAKIGRQAADALHYAHGQCILHRDVKPANFLLDFKGHVWVADFGLAKMMEESQLSRSEDVVGTLRYLAPEAFSSRTDARSDVYGLGLTLYELLTLRPAYEDTDRAVLVQKITSIDPVPPRSINPDVPRDLETIVLKATARDPAGRYVSAAAMAGDLECYLEDRPIQSRRPSAAERIWRWCRRNRAVASLSAAVLALLTLVAVVSTVGYFHLARANVLVSQSLERESRHRKRVEGVAKVSLDTLDDIFAELAPQRETSSKMEVAEFGGHRKYSFVFSNHTAALLEQMPKFYERLALQIGEDASILKYMTLAERRLAYTRQMMGQYAEAQTGYLRALGRCQVLMDKQPGDPAALLEAAAIHNELGNVYWSLEEAEEAFKSYHEAIAISELESSGGSLSAERQFEMARSYFFLRRRLAPSRFPLSLVSTLPESNRFEGWWWGEAANLDKATELAEDLLRESPDDPRFRHLLALCYRERNPEERMLGQVFSVDQPAEILEELVEQFPEVPEYRYDLALAYANVNVFGQDLSDDSYPVVAERMQMAKPLMDGLTRRHPDVLKYAEGLAEVHHQTAEVFRHTDYPGGGPLSEYSRAQGVLSLLAGRHANVASYKVWSAVVLLSSGGLLTARGRTETVQEKIESARALLEGVAVKDEIPQDVRLLLIRAYAQLGDLLRQTGDEEQAADALQQAEAQRASLLRPRSDEDVGSDPATAEAGNP